MSLLVLRGNYTPEAWGKIKANPDEAPAEIEDSLRSTGGSLLQFFFSLDQFDFYCFARVTADSDLIPLRHALFSRGNYSLLEGEPLMSPGELLPRLQQLWGALSDRTQSTASAAHQV